MKRTLRMPGSDRAVLGVLCSALLAILTWIVLPVTLDVSAPQSAWSDGDEPCARPTPDVVRIAVLDQGGVVAASASREVASERAGRGSESLVCGRIAGRMTSAGLPVAERGILLSAPPPFSARFTYTAPDGTFGFEGVPAGLLYSLKAMQHVEIVEPIPAATLCVSVEAHRLTWVNLDVVEPPRTTIRGTVAIDGRFASEGSVFARRLDAEGLASVYVQARSPIDAAGGYEIHGLAPGDYELEVRTPDRLGRDRCAALPYRLSGGSALFVPLEFRFGTLRARAKDPFTGEPRSGLPVVVRRATRNGWTVCRGLGDSGIVSAVDGSIAIEGLAAGTYEVRLLDKDAVDENATPLATSAPLALVGHEDAWIGDLLVTPLIGGVEPWSGPRAH